MDVAAIRFEVDDRVADQLAGTVIGYVATAAGLVYFNQVGSELLLIGQDVAAVSTSPKGEDVRMLEKE